MLETPLYGKFANEDRILVFSAPTAYHALIRTCVVGGGLATVYGALGFVGVTEPPIGTLWWFCTSLAVCLAGVFAAYSLVMIRFDARTGQYRRREGASAFGATTCGPLTALDALVLIAEPNSRMVPNGVTYHLVLHWKAGAEPPMVLQSDTRAMMGTLNSASGPLRERGIRYAQALKVTFYDNAHFPSACPVRTFR